MILQGDIWYANLSPIKGSEQSGYRPVLIVSGNLMNKHLGIVICLPLTSKVKHYKGNVVLTPNNENGLKEASEVLNFHIRSISKDRLIKKCGSISKEELKLTKKGVDELMSY